MIFIIPIKGGRIIMTGCSSKGCQSSKRRIRETTGCPFKSTGHDGPEGETGNILLGHKLTGA